MDFRRLLLGIGMALALAACADAQAATRGADVPWITYEAEQAKSNGTILGPDYSGQTPAREASGRRCVRLAETGQFLEFKATADAQGMVVRYCLPDSPDGRGIDATLSLYINGSLQSRLPMTSRLCYLYGKYPFSNDPSDGTPRHFWDELRLMPGTIHSGDTVRLQKDAGDTAGEYLIDLVDLEAVPPAIARPANSLSVTDFGATADGRTDDHAAFVSAIAAGKSQNKTVWIPTGRYVIGGALIVDNVTVRGAGIWYSSLIGVDHYVSSQRVAVYGDGPNVTLSDFSITGNLNYRNDQEPNDGLGGSFATGSTIRNVWVEHTKTGAWLVNSDGLVVEGCRFRDTIADGINLCVGMRDTIVRNCSTRGTGDDCFAAWPATYQTSIYQAGHNRFVHCTAQLPFFAQGISIYGGEGNSVEDCKVVDVCCGAGLFASTTFPTEFGFRGVTSFRRIDLLRTGGSDGAIGLVANLIPLNGVTFQDVNVLETATDGIKFTSIGGHRVEDARFDRIRIVHPGISGQGSGIVEAPGAAGSATVTNVTIDPPNVAGVKNESSAFNLVVGAGNSGVAESEAAGRASVGP